MTDDDWDFFNKSVGKLEKEVITLKKENERLKENIHSMLFTDDVVQKRYDKVKQENTKLKELLREWVQFETEENPNDFTVISERMSGLANKTKQAIGEK